MNDPTGTIGLPREKSQDDELAVIYKGGGNFMARMQALGELRDSQEEAFAKLQLGTDAKAALDRATQARTEAESLHSEAAAVLERAKTEAASILDGANKAAAGALAKATQEATRLTGEAAKTKADADTYAAEARRSVDKAMQQAKEIQAAAEAALADAKAAGEGHRKAVAAAEATVAQVNAKQVVLQAKIKRLHEVIAEVTAG